LSCYRAGSLEDAEERSAQGFEVTSDTWRPTTFLRWEKCFETSIGTAKIVTDATKAYIKPMGNRQGPHVLACEWVGSQLAQWFGLSTPEFALINVTEMDEIPLWGGRMAAPGPAFVSKAIEGNTFGGSVEEIEKLVNPEDIARLVVFDTWTLNCDRYPADVIARRPNRDNVFFAYDDEGSDMLRITAIDHTHCFTCGRDLTSHIAGIAQVKDERLYGLFPEFEVMITKARVDNCVNRLRQVDEGNIETVIDSIPQEWEVPSEARSALKELICRRAAFLSDRIAEMLEPYYPSKQDTFGWEEDSNGNS
jgi:hypothetical protein